MKYVTYNLDWEGATGNQPYPDLSPFNVSFDGGYAVKNGTYFGYLDGTENMCNAAIEACVNFNMTELTEEQALAYWMDVIPLGTQVVDENGTKTTGQAIVVDGRIQIPLT